LNDTTNKKFYRYDLSPLWEIHKGYFFESGLKPWKSGAVPFSGVSNYNEAYKKARLVIENLKKIKKDDLFEIKILELASGNGEFARNFLYVFQEICEAESLNYFSRLKFSISDFSQKTLDELKASGRFDKFQSQIQFECIDVLNPQVICDSSFDCILANYLLDQFPARIFVKDANQYFEKYIAVSDDKKYYHPGKNFIKRIPKFFEFRSVNLSQELSIQHLDIFESCFRASKTSTAVYSYGALRVLRNLLPKLNENGILIMSDFHGASRGGFDKYEPCYYGNSIAHPVNFEFIAKYFQDYPTVILYEDPIKPLHTLILARPDFSRAFELGEIYHQVYLQNKFIRVLYRFLVEFKLSLYLFLLIAFLMVFLCTLKANV